MFYEQYTLPYEPLRTAILIYGPLQCGYIGQPKYSATIHRV